MHKKQQKRHSFHNPFGSIMQGRQFSVGGVYRYGFNTQEKEPELGQDVYTAEFWMYSAQLGRRWNCDPKPNSSYSVYSCFSNNPIIFNDVYGDTLTKTLQDEADKLKVTAMHDISILQEVKRKMIKSLPEGGSFVDDSNTDEVWKEMKNIDAAITELSSFIAEIEIMEKSTTFFDLALVADKLNPDTRMNSDGTVTITMGSASSSLLIHELKHGFQFINGDLSWDKALNIPGILTDINDEVAAYKRQWAYLYLNGINTVTYSEITSELVRQIGEGLYNYHYSENVNCNSILTSELLVHYFNGMAVPKEAKKYIGKPIVDFMNARNEIYAK